MYLASLVWQSINLHNGPRAVDTMWSLKLHQTEVFREHVNQTVAAKELLEGDGDGKKIIDILFEQWWSPLAVQKRIRDIVEMEDI